MTAVIYARYSSYNQTERSIEGQIEDCTAYAAANGITVVDTYCDRARSATTDARPEFQRMIRDSDKHAFDVVLVYKLDRFARNRYDSAHYKQKLKKNNVRVTSVCENISADPEGIILESLLEGMAEYYSANLSQNVKRGLRVARERGTFTGGYLPYGFRVENKRVVIDEHEAEAVRYLFDRYAAGDRLRDIIDTLNARGYRPRTGVKFTTNSFQNALRNRKYIGEFYHDGELMPDAYPRIIDDDTFSAVQRRIDAVKRAPAAAKAKVDYLLQGKAFCGHCGANMVGESGRGRRGGVYNYYACAIKKRDHACKKKNERKEVVEGYVVEQTLRYILTPERIDMISSRLVEEYEKEFSASGVAKLEQLAVLTEREIEECVDALIEHRKNPKICERVQARFDELTARKEDIEIDLAKLRVAAKIRLTKEQYAAWLHSFAGGDPADEEFRRRVIDAFVNAVYLFDDKIVIYYNVRGEEPVSYTDMIDDIDGIDGTCGAGFGSDLAGIAPPKQKGCLWVPFLHGSERDASGSAPDHLHLVSRVQYHNFLAKSGYNGDF